MAEAIAFAAATRARILEELARRLAPQRARVFLDGAARELSPEVLLRTSSGRVIEVRAGAIDGARALMRVVLAAGGRIEVQNDEAVHGPIESYPRFDALFAEAEAAALSLLALLRPFGGLAAVPVADLDQLVAQLGDLPDAASAVLRLADGMRTLAAILRDSPYDEMLTARILQRLFGTGILTVPAASAVSEAQVAVDDPIAAQPAHSYAPPASGAELPSALPTEDELEGEGVDADIREWLENENVPETLLSDDSFTQAFAVASPEPSVLPHPELADSTRPRRTPPPPEPEALGAEDDDEDEDVDPDIVAARTPNRAVLAGALGALLVIVLFMGWLAQRDSVSDEDRRREEEARIAALRPDTGPAVLVVTATTSTVTATPDAGLARVTPPIAGPDAPEDVRRAEQLLNQGAYTEAGAMLASLRETRPQDPAVWVLSGQHYVDSGGKLQLATEAADRAIEIDPKFYRAWVLKGSVLQFLGRRAKAAEAYERAVSLEPNHPMSEELRMVIGQLGR